MIWYRYDTHNNFNSMPCSNFLDIKKIEFFKITGSFIIWFTINENFNWLPLDNLCVQKYLLFYVKKNFCFQLKIALKKQEKLQSEYNRFIKALAKSWVVCCSRAGRLGDRSVVVLISTSVWGAVSCEPVAHLSSHLDPELYAPRDMHILHSVTLSSATSPRSRIDEIDRQLQS